jgi:hypothetical protein
VSDSPIAGTTPEALIETVRDFCIRHGSALRSEDDPLPALDALAGELKERDQRIHELEVDPDRPNVIYAGDELEAAEDELERMTAAYEAAVIDYDELERVKELLALTEAQLVDTRLLRLEEAVRKELSYPQHERDWKPIRDALAEQSPASRRDS